MNYDNSDFAEIYPEEPEYVFFTEWCLSSGILKCKGVKDVKKNDGEIVVNIGGHRITARQCSWARTFEEAQRQAEEMRFKAKQRAIKELQNLEGIRFDTFKEAN